MLLTGGSCPAPLSTTTPWPFCTTSTVMASGNTNSTSAPTDHTGVCTKGCAQLKWPSVLVSMRPNSAMASAPTSMAPRMGGMRLPSAGAADSSRNTTTIGAVIHTSACSERTKSSPKRRNTPATMPITIGMGNDDINRFTQPLKPSSKISALVA